MRGRVVLAFGLLLAGCKGEPLIQPVSPEPSPAGSPSVPSEPVDQSQYLGLPETGEVEITGSCELTGPDGPVLRSELANGGSLQIVRLEGTDFLSISALPSPEADPVGTNVPSDTTYSEEDGFLEGISQLWLDDTDMSIQVSFRVHWDDSIPAC